MWPRKKRSSFLDYSFPMDSMHPEGRADSYEAPVPGCLGRVVNLFDLTSGIARNKLLTNKPHHDVSPLSRSRSDISGMKSPNGQEIENKMIDSDMRSSVAKMSEGTPVKKLIAQEMSNSSESRHSSPNVVAKLMGLDALPQEHYLPNFGHRRRTPKGYSRNSYSEIPVGSWQQGDDFICGKIDCENHCPKDRHKYKDIYEIWHPSPQASRSVPPRKGSVNDCTNEEKMALVRQKFMEAKRLSTDERLRQTKEFQDALEVLSSNQDLFLKVLQEPDSLVSGHFFGQQQIPPPSETKHITVLKPSKLVPGSEKQFKKSPTKVQTGGKDNHHYRFFHSVATSKVEECPPLTRIVVLKPSPGRIQEGKALFSSTQPINLRQAEFIENPGDDEAREAMEVAKEITQKMRENLAGHRRDETLLSSVFSNGYTGDESSFNKSEAETLVGSLSDSEIMSPVSRHSWDCVSQYGSRPYSCSLFSHASCSPESSVCREAKKRLSERWAMVASNGTGGEQRHVRRSPSTLGEMLALSDVTQSEIFEVDGSKREHESRASASCLTANTTEGENESPGSLMRSKSLPVSSTASGQRLTLGQDISKTAGLKETLKQVTKSSFRGRVASLFFSRITKSSKKTIGISPTHSMAQLDSVENLASPEAFDHGSKCSVSEEVHCPNKSSLGTSSEQGALSVSNPAAAVGHNQERLSPISAPEPALEDYGKGIKGSSISIVPKELGKSFFLGKSNLIDKSPPIGSVPRTLSWDDEHCTDTGTSKVGGAKEEEKEEEELRFLVRTLLSAASLESVSKLRWHSPDSPLDPLLRDKYANINLKELSHDAKWRPLRSIRWLVFDCVNAALSDLTGPMGGAALEDRVWARVKEWLKAGSCEGEAMWSLLEDEGGDSSGCLVAERVARKEVMGKGWDDERREVENMVKEIEGKLMKDMVEEYVE